MSYIVLSQGKRILRISLASTDLSHNAAQIGYLLRNAFRVNHFLEHVDHVVVLTVDVADDDHWLLDLKEIGFVLCTDQIVIRNRHTLGHSSQPNHARLSELLLDNNLL